MVGQRICYMMSDISVQTSQKSVVKYLNTGNVRRCWIFYLSVNF